MKNFSINAVNDIYSCGQHIKIKPHKVSHSKFKTFYYKVREFERFLGEESDESYWKDFLRPIKFYRFNLCAAPLPINWKLDELLEAVRKPLRLCRLMYPNFSSSAQKLIENLQELAEVDDNPILTKMLRLSGIARKPRVAMLVKESRLVPTVEQILANHPDLCKVEVLNPYQIRNSTCYDTLIIIGRSRWFPDYAFSAPRAKTIHLISYRWVSDEWKPKKVFVTPTPIQKVFPLLREYVPQKSLTGPVDELLPSIDWDAAVSKVACQWDAERSTETVKAKLFLLADEMAVFLDASDSSKVLVIDFELLEDEDEQQEQTSEVKRIPSSRIHPGMFILLRTSGGGDYIVPLANRILQEQAVRVRNSQQHWKRLLQDAISDTDVEFIIEYLRNEGSERANKINLRNWMSSENICPRSYNDFRAIMRVIGLDQKTDEYWQAAKAIEQAHRMAGQQIRKQLLQQVLNSHPKELHRWGRMDFELAEADGGRLTAFRVEQILSESREVPVSHIGEPFKLEGIDGDDDSYSYS